MEVFKLIIAVLSVVVLSSLLSRLIPKVSTPLVQIACGLALSQLPAFAHVQLDPELFMVMFIAPLLYLEAREIDKLALVKHLKHSLSLAIGLALLTMVVVGLVLHAVWAVVPLAAACALGAALGPTDAVAVSALSDEASLSARQRGILQGESLLNDASGIVGFQFSVLAVLTGSFEVGEAGVEFFVSFLGGVLLGGVVGVLINWLFERLRALGWETITSRILLELFMPVMLYLLAEDVFHVSGILAVVAAGLLIRFDRTGIGPNIARTNIVSDSVWSVLSFSLNGTVFVMLGMIIPSAMVQSWRDPLVNNAMLIGSIFLVAAVVMGLRFIWIALMLGVSKDVVTRCRRPMDADRWRSAAVMTFGGPKGTITLALMLTLPYVGADATPFPMRAELIFIASGVILITMLLANFLVPLLVPRRDVTDASRELNAATIAVLRRTMEDLSAAATPENRVAVLRVIDSYNKRIQALKRHESAQYVAAFAALQIEALRWEKQYIKGLLAHEKRAMPSDERDCRMEACERMLDAIMNALRHIQRSSLDRNERGRWRVLVSRVRGRLMALRHRSLWLLRRVVDKIRRVSPLFSEDMVSIYTREIHLQAMEHVIGKLHHALDENVALDASSSSAPSSFAYSTEVYTALLLDYRRAEAVLRSRPSLNRSTTLLRQIEDVKRDSYVIELGIIQDMYERHEISRAQARSLRSNVYVMQVDADAEVQ